MKITIERLRLPATIGIYAWEQVAPRELSVTIIYNYDAIDVIAQDSVAAAIDYDAVTKAARDLAGNRSWGMIETLAAELASRLLQDFAAMQDVSVTVYKPFALEQAESVSATIHRVRS